MRAPRSRCCGGATRSAAAAWASGASAILRTRQRGLEAGPNRDRTFRWFEATHGGAVAYEGGRPVFAPGLLEEAARWLGLRLGAKRAAPAVRTPLPPANGPEVANVSGASAVYGP